MGQVRHGSATTTHAVRAAIQRSQASLAQLSRELGLNPKTVAKWRKRTTVGDMNTGGYPSLFCGACEGTGRAPEATVIALAPEMLRIASEIGEPEDPFAAWESIDLIKSQNDQLRRVLNKTGDWINSLPVPTSCATRMFGLVRAAANEVIGGMNDQGSNREILEKVCLNDPDNAPKNENIATSAAKGCAE
jgi:transposase-like protein